MQPISQVLAEPDPQAELVRSLMDYAQNGYGFTDDIGANTSNEDIERWALAAVHEAAQSHGIDADHPAAIRATERLVVLGFDHREGLTIAGVRACYAHLEETSLEALGLAP